jgi:chemotaxis response regulator CheB
VKRIRVLVVDDSPTSRQLLVAILRTDNDIEVVGQAADGLEAVEMVKPLHPDIVTMDVQMPKLDGFAATKRSWSRLRSHPHHDQRRSSRLVVSLEAVRVGAGRSCQPGLTAPAFDEESRARPTGQGHVVRQGRAPL